MKVSISKIERVVLFVFLCENKNTILHLEQNSIEGIFFVNVLRNFAKCVKIWLAQKQNKTIVTKIIVSKISRMKCVRSQRVL